MEWLNKKMKGYRPVGEAAVDETGLTATSAFGIPLPTMVMHVA